MADLFHVWYSKKHEQWIHRVADLHGKTYVPPYYRLEDGSHVRITEANQADLQYDADEYPLRWEDAIDLGFGRYCCHGLDG